jgi:hypothetical protein
MNKNKIMKKQYNDHVFFYLLTFNQNKSLETQIEENINHILYF